jgi:hypothetical protein
LIHAAPYILVPLISSILSDLVSQQHRLSFLRSSNN